MNKSILQVRAAFWLRMNLLRRDTLMVVGIVMSIAVLFWSLNSMIEVSDEYSSLPIGIVDYDKTSESVAAVERMKQISSLRIIEESQKILNDLLLDEMIYGYFILEEGFEENVKQSNTKHLLSAYYLKDTPFVKIISDIVAGEIIYPITLYKTLNYYQRLDVEEDKLSAEEFMDYMEELVRSSPDFDFAFDTKVIVPSQEVREKQPSNQLFYNQIMVGILGIVMGFVAMFLMMSVVKEREFSLDQRKWINGFSPICDRIGTLGYGSVIMTITLLGILFLMNRSISSFTWREGLKFGTLAYLYGVVYLSFFYLIASSVKSVIRYQMIGTITLLLTASCGFISLLIDTDLTGLLEFIKFIPNVWFIRGFADIMMKTRYNLWSPAFGISLAMIIGLSVLQTIFKSRNFIRK